VLKTCNKCKCSLDYSLFSKDLSKKDGLRTICKTCTSISQSSDEYKRKARDRKRTEHKMFPEINMHSMAKARAEIQNVPFNISKTDIKIPDKCPILGLTLQVNSGKVSYNSPSLDRIVPEKGYVIGNIQVVSHLANTMKSSASKENLIKFAEWVIEFFDLHYNIDTRKLESKQL
jgi:hypothetical protein